MDFKNNNGQERDDIIQNRFTAYLLSSVNRKRRSYIIRIDSKITIWSTILKKEWAITLR